MLEEEKISLDIEIAREKLHQLALKKGCDFGDPEVIQLSQEVDAFIVQYEQRIGHKKRLQAKARKKIKDAEADEKSASAK